MKATVIGPGAMGCLFSARLALSGVQTTLVDYRGDRAGRLQQAGITIETLDGPPLLARPAVATRVPDGQDVVIVLTKAGSTGALRLPHNTPVLTLQNGLNNVETLCSLVGSACVLAGTTCEAATLLGEGRVRHVAAGQTALGAWTSCQPQVAAEILGKAGFQVEITEAPGQKLWEKVAINSGINPLTALLDVPNGRLLELVEARQLMRDLVVEAAKIAATEGYRFEYSLVEHAEDICRQTANNISSMLQDIRAGRQTEIDAISGEIIRRAELASLPVPRTRVVWQLVKGLESR